MRKKRAEKLARYEEASGRSHASRELFEAAKTGDLTAITRAVELGACLDDRNNHMHHPPLMEAIGHRRQKFALKLLEAGANPNIGNSYNNTPLIRTSDPVLMRSLLDHGAHPDAMNRGGYTPLICACEAGDVESVTLLLAAGANPTRAMYVYRTPLKASANQECRDLVQNAINGIRPTLDQTEPDITPQAPEPEPEPIATPQPAAKAPEWRERIKLDTAIAKDRGL